MSTVPASLVVDVVPSVLSAGGTGLNGIGLMLSNGTRIPLGDSLTDGELELVSHGAQARKASMNAAAVHGLIAFP